MDFFLPKCSILLFLALLTPCYSLKNNLKQNNKLTSPLNSENTKEASNSNSEYDIPIPISNQIDSSNPIFPETYICAENDNYCYSEDVLIIPNKDASTFRYQFIEGNILCKMDVKDKQYCYTGFVTKFKYTAGNLENIDYSNKPRICLYKNENSSSFKYAFMNQLDETVCKEELFTYKNYPIQPSELPKDPSHTIKFIPKIEGSEATGCFCADILPSDWTLCSKEDEICNIIKGSVIRYGSPNSYVYKYMSQSFICDNQTLGKETILDNTFDTNSKIDIANGNECWYLKENENNHFILKKNDSIKNIPYKAVCELSANDKIITDKIFDPNDSIICNYDGFKTFPNSISSLEENLSCKCQSFN